MDFALPAAQGIALLLLLGFVLVAAEVFVPGMILGLVGAMCLMAGVAWSYAAYGAITGTLVLSGVAVFGTVALLGYLRAFPKTYLGRQVINSAAMPKVADSIPSDLLGQKGESLTALRPSGTGRIAGRRVDVVAEGSFIEAHQPIIVVRVENNYLVVRKA